MFGKFTCIFLAQKFSRLHCKAQEGENPLDSKNNDNVNVKTFPTNKTNVKLDGGKKMQIYIYIYIYIYHVDI